MLFLAAGWQSERSFVTVSNTIAGLAFETTKLPIGCVQFRMMVNEIVKVLERLDKYGRGSVAVLIYTNHSTNPCDTPQDAQPPARSASPNT